ncbi:FimV family protein [Variovorax sp. Sphag1AA]|uniref:type IV pilus assembly protein FimV n=1 Tax=Variovorax sp. Sphag1AA TaxID=2587027 RepID=UPI00160A505D|nr:hypothetical protein [Variovorax sp. Sphag1AA]MBB3176165.1 hypothetical protein [Variovorax sp. Sphag1AA]
MTIGRPQGAVWIGKPIDMVIPLALDAAETGGSLCLGAEVLQGDTPMLERRVTVSLESGNSPGNSNIRVRTTAPVEEPVVTIKVSAGCDMKSTRSYVLLADVPSDVTPPGVSLAGARPSSDAAPAQRSTARSASRSTGGGGGGAASPDGTASPTARRAAARSSAERESTAQSAPQASAPVAPAPRRAAPVIPRAVPAARPAAVAPPKAETVATGPRLQVEALEPEPTKDSGLKTTSQLVPPPAEDPARRAAAAALWTAMNPAAEQAQRENQRNKELEATLAALREQTAQNQRALLELRSELAQARESQFRNPLVYALIAGLLLALIALLLLWRANRRTAAAAWWRESVLQPETEGGSKRLRRNRGLLDEGDADADSEDEPPRKRTLGMTTFGATPFAPLEPDDEVEAEAPRVPARPLESATARPVNTEELFDVQQQSDFFLSLGQQDQAIDVLREHIAANPGTSALAYLDLLRIYHSLDRREDYAHLAEEFEHAFNADVPPFDKYTDAGKGLEHYRSALARIESQWPAPSTLALIEELIFRKPGVHEDGAFDLAAYQELLLLYALAKEVIEPDTAPPPATVTPPPFNDTHTATATAPLWPDTMPPVMHDGPTLPPSIYGSIDDRLHHDTVMAPAPDAPIAPAHDQEREAPPRAVPPPELDLAEFDKTAYETMPTPIEPPKPPAPSSDPHVIDFELFDPTTEAEIAPKTKSIKR